MKKELLNKIEKLIDAVIFIDALAPKVNALFFKACKVKDNFEAWEVETLVDAVINENGIQL